LSLEIQGAIDLTQSDQSLKWIQSQNGSEFCQFDDISDEVRSQLRREDKYTIAIYGIRYTVKDYDGKWLVFRRNLGMNNVKTTNQPKHYMIHVNNVHEIKIMPLVEANEYLLSKNQEYQIFGSDPVKIINNDVCVVMAKYTQPSTTRVQSEP
jgi:hypothetical protein